MDSRDMWPAHFVARDGGAPGWNAVITCRKCGAEDETRRASARSRHGGNRLLERTFAGRVWTKITLGAGVCPACSTKPKEDMEVTAQQQTTQPLQLVKSPAMKARIPELYMVLEDAYDPALKVYRKGMTDAKIAADLGMSEDFVRQRREQDFGPLIPPKIDPIEKIGDSFAAVEVEFDKVLGAPASQLSVALVDFRNKLRLLAQAIHDARKKP